MRISGRAKGDKITSYTHAVVQPNAPKSRYIMSYHSSEKKAKEYVDKYSKHIPGGLDIIKGDPGAPTQAALKSAQGKTEDMTSTASIPNPADTAMGPRIKTTTMHDKRRKKDQFPVLLKRFRKYIEDNG